MEKLQSFFDVKYLGPLSIVLPILYMGKLHFNGGVCRLRRNLVGKTVLITGCNTGIGKATAISLASMGAKVIMACRSRERAVPALQEIIRKSKNKEVHFMPLNLESLESVNDFAKEFLKENEKLDILVLNAGIMMLQQRELTLEGQEKQFGTNHLGHFLLTNLLLEPLRKAQPSRVVVVSSKASIRENADIHFGNISLDGIYNPSLAYRQSKLANVMFARELQRRFDQESSDVRVVSLHPGVVRTELGRHFSQRMRIFTYVIGLPFYYMTKNATQGAQTSLYCSLESPEKLVPGGYYADCAEATINPKALDPKACEKLWEFSEEIVGLKQKQADLKINGL